MVTLTRHPQCLSSTAFHIVGDLVSLLNELGVEQVFLVGHDWGAIIAWYFSLLRSDRIKALVNTSVACVPRNLKVKRVESYRALFADDYYICRFQVPGEIEEEFAQIDAEQIFKKLLTLQSTEPLCVPKQIGFRVFPDPPFLPSWLSEEDINYYASKFSQIGFTGGLNYYRALDLNWELAAPWIGSQIKVPVKFIFGDLDVTYHIPGVKEFIPNGGFKREVPFLQEVVVMEGVAHFLNQQKPHEVSNHIYDFIKKFLIPFSFGIL